jgi:hypothetical protein
MSEVPCIGDTVKISGLISRVDLNDETAVVIELLSTGRLAVIVERTSEIISISLKNLLFVPKPETMKFDNCSMDLPDVAVAHSLNSNLKVWANKSFFYPC